jgi:hypothetical protein
MRRGLLWHKQPAPNRSRTTGEQQGRFKLNQRLAVVLIGYAHAIYIANSNPNL